MEHLQVSRYAAFLQVGDEPLRPVVALLALRCYVSFSVTYLKESARLSSDAVAFIDPKDFLL